MTSPGREVALAEGTGGLRKRSAKSPGKSSLSMQPGVAAIPAEASPPFEFPVLEYKARPLQVPIIGPHSLAPRLQHGTATSREKPNSERYF